MQEAPVKANLKVLELKLKADSRMVLIELNEKRGDAPSQFALLHHLGDIMIQYRMNHYRIFNNNNNNNSNNNNNKGVLTQSDSLTLLSES